MENDATCKTIGICRIKLKIFDGKVPTTRNVRHVQDLKKNLSSLGVSGAAG